MRREKILELGSFRIRVHEPTIEGIRNVLSREDMDFDPLGYLSGHCEIPADLVFLFTDAPGETLKQLTLSEFEEVLAAIRELLSPFLQILEMLGAASGYLRGVQRETSTGPSAS